MEDKQFEVLAQKVNGVDEAVARVDRDMADDRNKIDDLTIAISEVKKEQEIIRQEQKNLSERLTKMDRRIKDGIRDAVKEAILPLQKQLEEFNKKKVLIRTININPLVKWWKGLRG